MPLLLVFLDLVIPNFFIRISLSRFFSMEIMYLVQNRIKENPFKAFIL